MFESLKTIKLSQHFSTFEVLWSDILNNYMQCNDFQFYLHKELANTVETLVRLPYGTTLISSGQRNKKIVKQLEEMGRKPAKNTDHFFTVNLEKKIICSGAWDISPAEQDTEIVFYNIIEYLKEDEYMNNRVGQVIFYPNRCWKGKHGIIHISNSRYLIFNKDFVEKNNLLHKSRFLISETAGKYKVV